MKNFILYDVATGRITQSCRAPTEGAVASCLQAGQALLEVDALVDNTKVYLQGVILKDMPARPDPHHTFDWPTKQWQDLRTLQDLKDAKWDEIKHARSAAEYGGFTWDGSTFDSDAISQARIQGAVQLAGMAPGFSIDWTLADNQVRTLSAANMLAVGAALGLHVATQFSLARVLREQIESATADQLSEVAWPAN